MPPSSQGKQSPVGVIKSPVDYVNALAAINRLFSSKRVTSQAAALESLLCRVEVYEESAFPIGPRVPIKAVRFRSEQEQSEL